MSENCDPIMVSFANSYFPNLCVPETSGGPIVQTPLCGLDENRVFKMNYKLQAGLSPLTTRLQISTVGCGGTYNNSRDN